MNRKWRPYRNYLFLIVLASACYILFFHRLGSIGFIGPDEPRYASIAREMLRSNDYVTPRLNGEAWFEKPALMYWGAAIGYKIFGVNEWGARFPSALAATLCVILIYWCGSRLWSPDTGFAAALIMASSIGFFSFARAASMDMPLTGCLTAALVFFLIGDNDESPQKRWWFYFFYAAVGLGVLAKGPIAWVLPAISLLGYMAARGRMNEWRRWRPKAAWLAFAVPAPWYAACTFANGYQFIQVFIINHNLERYASTIHGHDRPIYFYLPVFLLLTFPWTFLLIPALRRKLGRTEQLLIWWAVIPIVFFSFSGSKLPGYILPVVPPVAMLLAPELLAASTRCFKVAAFIEAGAMAFIGVAFGFYGNTLNVDPHVSGMLIAGVTFAAAAVLCVIALWLPPSFLGGFNAVVISGVLLVATNLVFPRFDNTDTMRPWKQALEQILPQGQTVILYKTPRWMEYSLQFYRYGAVRTVDTPQELASVTAPGGRVFCIAEDHSLDELSKTPNVDLQIVHTIANRTAFWMWRTH